MRIEICVGGAGGQGVLLFGTTITHAAALEGKEAVCLPSYGAEARGGEVKCFVIFSDDTVKSPFPEKFDHLVLFSQAAFTRFQEHMRPGVTIFHDASRTDAEGVPEGVATIGVPLDELVRGLDRRCGNMAMMGVFIATTGMFAPTAMAPALRGVAKGKGEPFIDMNLKAIAAGHQWATEQGHAMPVQP